VLSIWLVVSIFLWLPVVLPMCTEPLQTTRHGFHPKSSPLCPASGSGGSRGHSSGSGGHSSGSSSGGVSEMATLLGVPSEEALRQLLSRDTAGYFSPATLFGFAALYYATSVFTYGLQIPSGACALPTRSLTQAVYQFATCCTF
jgi:hypothetical protein